MTDTVIHLDADKRRDPVYYQRHVMGNFIKLLADIRARYVDLAALHDEWTAQLEAEARQPPKDEDERLQRVRAFLDQLERFGMELIELDHYDIDRLPVAAGRRFPEQQQQIDQLIKSALMPPRSPRPPLPKWELTDDGARDINGNFRIELARCATAHLDYYKVRDRDGDIIAETATMDEAADYVDAQVVGYGPLARRWIEQMSEVTDDTK